MRHRTVALSPLLLVALPALSPAAALADDRPPGPEPAPAVAATAPAPAFAFGARIGGYGFRREDGDRRNAWDECRMNGLGVFGERAVTGPLFVEAGIDLYFSESFPQAPVDTDLPIDRMSGLVTAAIGLRAAGPWRTSGYAQLGVGLELTRVSVPYGDDAITDQQALPAGFLGVGGDVRVGAGTYLGASLRAHVMGNFEYDPEDLEMQPGWTSPPAAAEVFAASPDAAAQVQFYVRREL